MPSYGATATQAVFAENRVITFLAFWLEVACENDYRDMHKIWEDGPQPPPQRPLLITHTHTHTGMNFSVSFGVVSSHFR